MTTIKLSSKRQATLPVEVCKTLGVTAGDFLELRPLCHENEMVWVLKPAPKLHSPWIGSLASYAARARRPWSREEHGEITGQAIALECGK